MQIAPTETPTIKRGPNGKPEIGLDLPEIKPEDAKKAFETLGFIFKKLPGATQIAGGIFGNIPEDTKETAGKIAGGILGGAVGGAMKTVETGVEIAENIPNETKETAGKIAGGILGGAFGQLLKWQA